MGLYFINFEDGFKLRDKAWQTLGSPTNDLSWQQVLGAADCIYNPLGRIITAIRDDVLNEVNRVSKNF